KIHEYIRVARPNRGGRAVGEVDAAIGQAYVVDDVDELFGRNDLANRRLHRVAERRGFFDARPRASAHVQLDLTAVDAGEEVLAEPRQRAQGKREQGGGSHAS